MQVDEDVFKAIGPYEALAASSFTSSVSSLKNEDGIFPFAHSSTPARAPASVFLPSISSRPQTPREMSLHFQLDAAQCSPIPGIPEEDGDVSSSKSSCQVLSSSSLKRQQKASSHRLSTSRDSESTDRSGDQRKSRPMPDMTAFEGDGSTASRDRSFDESCKSAGSKQRSSPRRQCPPTPVRTPAWAHSEAGGAPVFKHGGLKRYSRANSLIATKVLATCSPQVLDGRASLESSLGDSRESHEDRSKSGDFSDDDTALDDVAESGNGGWHQNARSDGHSASDGAISAAQRESLRGVGEEISMGTHFDVLSTLGRGTFADVFRVRSRMDGRLYAVKRNRRQFRGTRDREKALAEVKCMQRLQSFSDKHEGRPPYSLYILFFYQAWQEDGYFFCQTELCCRDTCRDVHEALRANWSVSKARYKSLSKLPAPPRDGVHPTSDGRLFPEQSLWKVLHDVSAGLSHIHSHGLVHFDIKPSNLFFVPHVRYGAITKIGDFGMAGEIGSSEDGQEGDQMYMAGELLSSDRKHPSADIFSLGLALLELASNLSFALPSDGPRWHRLRTGRQSTSSDIPSCRSADLVSLIHSMIGVRDERPMADSILQNSRVQSAGTSFDEFLNDYLFDVQEFDRREEQTSGFAYQEDQTPSHAHTTGRSLVCSPTAYFLPKPPILSSPEAAHS
jgi:membrane-associated tyrosine- and threonine-specific cdc2-inhibitory kinase